MKRSFRFFINRTIIMAIIFGAATGSHAAETGPVYAPVPAILAETRGGLGNVFTKLRAGGPVRIAYFGGSITEAGNGWRSKTMDWFRGAYPQSQIEEINAAIGGTGSDLGVYRFRQDVLARKPDLIFVEFAVNDGGAAPEDIWRGLEGIFRQAWKADPTIDICTIYTFRTGYESDLREGRNPRAASADEMLAAHYGIPSINVALPTVEMAEAGQLVYVPPKDEAGALLPMAPEVILFSQDGVHPLEAGHAIYATAISDALQEMARDSKPGPHIVPVPFIADNWENAVLVPLEAGMMSAGWKKLDAGEGLGKQFAPRVPSLWEATQPGETISFKFKGTACRLYDILGPDGGQVVITLDGKTGAPQPRFDSYSSYHRLAMLAIGSGLEDTVHDVQIEIHPDQPDRSSVVDTEKDKPGFDPKKYEGTAMRVGAILLLGELR